MPLPDPALEKPLRRNYFADWLLQGFLAQLWCIHCVLAKIKCRVGMRWPGQVSYLAPCGRCVNRVPKALFGIRQCGQGFGFYSLVRAVLVWRYTLYSSWAFAWQGGLEEQEAACWDDSTFFRLAHPVGL